MKTKVKELRNKSNLTQQQLADLVYVLSRTITSIEKEQYSPSLMLAYRMAKVFETTVEYLCCLKKIKNWRINSVKIYDKKKLIYGMISLLLGLTLLTLGFLKGFDAKNTILCVLMLVIGVSELFISINKEAAKKEHIEQSDERNRLVSLTSTSKAFHIAKNISFVLMLFFLIVGAKQEDPLIMGVGMGFAFSFSIMTFSDIFSAFYHEKHR